MLRPEPSGAHGVHGDIANPARRPDRVAERVFAYAAEVAGLSRAQATISCDPPIAEPSSSSSTGTADEPVVSGAPIGGIDEASRESFPASDPASPHESKPSDQPVSVNVGPVGDRAGQRQVVEEALRLLAEASRPETTRRVW